MIGLITLPLCTCVQGNNAFTLAMSDLLGVFRKLSIRMLYLRIGVEQVLLGNTWIDTLFNA